MNIAICQFDIEWENKEKNKFKIQSLLENNLTHNEDWLIFPEMTLTGFSMNSSMAALDDSDLKFFKDIAIKHNIFITFGGSKDSQNKLFTINKEGNNHFEYSKIHLFSFAKEDEYYKSGNRVSNFTIENAKITPYICYDLRFPYLFWNTAGFTDIYVVIANWPKSRREHWLTLLQSRAIENQSYVIGVNRVGKDLSLEYSGDSVIVNPLGEILIDAKEREGIFSCNADIKLVSKYREAFPILKDRKGNFQ
jgi:predicted amidohydrolase